MTTATLTAPKSTKKSKVKAPKCAYGRSCNQPVNTDHWLHMCDEHLAGAKALLNEQYEEHKYTRKFRHIAEDNGE